MSDLALFALDECLEKYYKNIEDRGFLLIRVPLMALLQPSSTGFELCILMLQG